jgi:hypothetical protein
MKYPDWWNKTVTLYKKFEEPDRGVYWQRTRLNGCFWSVKSERLPSGDNVITTLVYVVRVPCGRPIEAATGDICVLGKVSDEIDERTQGKRSSDFLKKYGQGAFLVRVFKDNSDALPFPHYFIGG